MARRATTPTTITVGTPADRILKWCAGIEERTVVCGHTHGQFERTVDGFTIVNAGSVGDPFGTPGAYWALLSGGVELRFTPYDTAATADAIRATGFPYGEVMAAQIVLTSTADDAARFFAGMSEGPGEPGPSG